MEEGGQVLITAEEEEAADSLLAALSDLAYAAPTKAKPKVKTRESRFFFTLSKSLSRTVKERAKVLKPKVMEHVDKAVEARLDTYKKEVPPELDTNISAVREFFLTQIGPKSLAGGAGASQAKEVVQRLLNTEIDGSQFERFDRMSAVAVNLAMANFVAAYYGLPKNAAAKILSALQPRIPAVIPVPQLPAEQQRPKPKSSDKP